MRSAKATAWGANAEAPATPARASLASGELYVDLTGLIDVAAELAKGVKERQRLIDLIVAKENKLANAGFVDRAPPEVVAKERASLVESRERLAALDASLTTLRAQARS